MVKDSIDGAHTVGAEFVLELIAPQLLRRGGTPYCRVGNCSSMMAYAGLTHRLLECLLGPRVVARGKLLTS